MCKTLTTLALTLVLATSAHAYDVERTRANLAADYARCSAYFIATTKALERSGEAATAALYDQSA